MDEVGYLKVVSCRDPVAVAADAIAVDGEVVSVDVEMVVSVVIADDLDARRDVIYSPTATSDWRTAHSEVETIDFSRGATQVDAQEVAFEAQRIQFDWRRLDFDGVAATSQVGKTRSMPEKSTSRGNYRQSNAKR
jgi:hypothetical protein